MIGIDQLGEYSIVYQTKRYYCDEARNQITGFNLGLVTEERLCHLAMQ